MNDNPEIVPASSTGVPAPPPQYSDLSAMLEQALRLRPLWIGFLLAGLNIVFTLAARFFVENTLPFAVLELGMSFTILGAIVYYFMCIHRLIRVLRTQADWYSEFTPAGVVWRQFVPFYGLYVMYQWTSDVENFVVRRLGASSAIGMTTFIGLLIGFGISYFDWLDGVGSIIVFGSLLYMYGPVKSALASPVTESFSFPKFDGSLGLR